jgi:hypothetical protein
VIKDFGAPCVMLQENTISQVGMSLFLMQSPKDIVLVITSSYPLNFLACNAITGSEE